MTGLEYWYYVPNLKNWHLHNVDIFCSRESEGMKIQWLPVAYHSYQILLMSVICSIVISRVAQLTYPRHKYLALA
jgi:hypothetical protein